MREITPPATLMAGTQHKEDVMKVSNRLVSEVRRCCHHGHGAAVFADGTVMQAISSNDVVARGNGAGGWEWRIGYVDDPKVTRDELQEIFDYAERMENGEY